jgi:hypothetical protein
MRSDAPPLMPIFRSRHQADLLTWLLLHPDQEYTVTHLAERLHVPLTTLHREAQRLADVDLIRSRTLGRSRLLQANPAHRATAALTQLLEVTFGPQTVIEDEFAPVPDVDRVLIYGSWADRYHGAPGAPPADIDVLVIGDPDRADVYDAADRAQDRLGVQVNPVIRSPHQWKEAADSLIEQIRSSPIVTVIDHDRTAA